MFEIINLSIKIENRYLIKNLSLSLNRGDKLAIIGEEGDGKSTLLKTLLGICDYAEITGTTNSKNYTIGYLAQFFNSEIQNKKVFDYLFNSLEEYYENVTVLYRFLEELSIDETLIDQKIETLSGGEKVKVGILKMLIDKSDILFLDEPTNDLDLDTLKWLEDFINKINNPIIYISHDETLLKNTANMILHMEQIADKTECRHTFSRTDYDTYVVSRQDLLNKQTQVAKSERREHQKKQEKLKKLMDKVDYQQKTISRQDPFGAKVLKKKMHTLKAQEKRLAKDTMTDIPDVEENIDLFFQNVYVPKGKIVAKIEIPKLQIGRKTLVKNIVLTISGTDHISIIGKNGVGKTTLIKQINRELLGRKDIKVGYMPQNYDEILKDNSNVLDFITEGKNKDEITLARTYLGSLKFTKVEMLGKIKNLSNGSKAKLILAKLVIDECNVLILDEPTRNLSSLSAPIIRKALKDFKGTIISVSHDRTYIEEVADIVYTLTPTGLIKEKYE